MIRKFLTLTPLTPYFFGGEHTFSVDDLRSEEKARFFAKSFKLPQQTTILGMLRKEILRAKGKLTTHKRGEWVDLPKRNPNQDNPEFIEVVKLVGDKPFDFDAQEELDFGIIKSISNVFLVRDRKIYYRAPADLKLNPRKIEGVELFLGNFKKDFIDFGIDPKKYSFGGFIHKSDFVSEDDIFEEVWSVGINKGSKDEGFFQKIMYRLKNGFSFGLAVELEEEVNLEGVVQLGGENSLFKLTLEDGFEDFDFDKKDGFERIVILSDTILPPKALKWCDFILGESRIIRNITRTGNRKSSRKRVLEAGSVIYTHNRQKLKEFLDIANLQKIGMNRYKEC
ncbi:type III-B CRISPR module-associated Cmr3 family protein [Hippea sp. KM1]|uniref:type III-B CRISPR module-associated Cmr3 family protein n=1 Tax=Hippea sp. KM1 TaxID=944481 RepID=UPI00046CA526|nr:type III-B CRISPR module-associated Cmr3 family protein [Hippea sp. KM1]